MRITLNIKFHYSSQGIRRKLMRLNSTSGADSTTSRSNQSLSPNFENSGKQSSFDITAKMTDHTKQNVITEKYNSLDIPRDSTLSDLPSYSNGLCNGSTSTPNHSVSSGEITSYYSSDNDVDSSINCSNAPSANNIKPNSPRYKQAELEQKKLSFVNHSQKHGGEYCERIYFRT